MGTKLEGTTYMVKLNLGSKYRRLHEFDNLDKLFGWHFQDGLPQYADDSVDAITISHALMFLEPEELLWFAREMYRVLKDGGVVRITEDDTENTSSKVYMTGNILSGPKCLTGPAMMRGVLESVGFTVHDVTKQSTHYSDASLIQAYRGGPPHVFFIEGIKNYTKSMNKIMEGFKTLKGTSVRIEDVSRDALPEFFVEMGFKRGAEIGVYKAEFLKKFCDAGLIMYGIDPWKAFYGQGRTQQVQERQDFLYGHAQRVLGDHLQKNCTLIRKDSMDAVNQFMDESLDFVYIDGDHEFAHVAEDIVAWSKKVRKGGIVAGHDYFSSHPKATRAICQVRPVVDAYVKAFKIPNFWYFGDDRMEMDKALSWMFVKE